MKTKYAVLLKFYKCYIREDGLILKIMVCTHGCNENF